MDAQRRHQLQENELAKALGESPDFFRRNLNLFLLIITLVLLVWVFLNYRARANEQTQALLSEGIGGARNMLEQLSSTNLQAVLITEQRQRAVESTKTLAASGLNTTPPDLAFFADMQQRNNERRILLARDIETSIESVLQASPSPAQHAMALLTRGDLYWNLANLPTALLSTTRPVEGASTSATTRTSPEFLQLAEDDYRKILTDHADSRDPVIQALFALAAIEENRGEWDKAKALYTTIESEKLALDYHKKAAKAKREAVAKIRAPVSLEGVSLEGKSSTLPTTLPATLPANAIE